MNRCALVTGANRGIGRETALQLAAHGLHIISAGRNVEACEKVADEITAAGGKATTAVIDLMQPASVEQFLRGLNEPVDLLINNAGIFPDPSISVFDSNPEDVRGAMEVHLHAPLQLARALIPKMQTRGYGRVVNLSSGYASLNGMAGELTAYRTSKAALNALTCILAAEVSRDVKVNAVDPGWVRTDMGGNSAPRSVEEAAADVVWAATLESSGPNGKLLRYREIADW